MRSASAVRHSVLGEQSLTASRTLCCEGAFFGFVERGGLEPPTQKL